MSSDTDCPPTPDIKLPDASNIRFKPIGMPCEWVEEYRPGGLHPVDLGDKFHGGMYTVIRKLGYGSSSTVWLAVDNSHKCYVALKIMGASKVSTAENELKIIRLLSEKAHKDPRLQYITALLDTFLHNGPNGRHYCLVYEPMGPSAAILLSELTMKIKNKSPGYLKRLAKKILSQTLQGLAFLHENNIVHGSVHPGNLLFCINNITHIEIDELRQDESKQQSVRSVERLDGKTDRWAPKNLYLGQSLKKYTPLDLDVKIKISDFGSAFCENNPPTRADVPVALRAPELILGLPFNASIDIWAFGCLIFEFLTDRHLFLVLPFVEKDESDDDHLLQFNDIIRKLPENLFGAWSRVDEWFDPITREDLKEDRLHQEPGLPYDSLEVMFAEEKPEGIDDGESAVICSLIRQILVYSPEQRPSAAELLKHPWFSE